MRRGSVLKGLRSLFSRAVRRVRAFFGWRERDGDAEREALALVVADQDAEKAVEETKRDGDGGDDGGGDPAPTFGRKRKADCVESEHGKRRAGYGEDGKPINYGKPIDVSDAEWERLIAEKMRAEQEDRELAEQQDEDDEVQRERLRLARRQREQRLRAAQEDDAKKAEAGKRPDLEAYLGSLREEPSDSAEDEVKPDEGRGMGF